MVYARDLTFFKDRVLHPFVKVILCCSVSVFVTAFLKIRDCKRAWYQTSAVPECSTI